METKEKILAAIREACPETIRIVKMPRENMLGRVEDALHLEHLLRTVFAQFQADTQTWTARAEYAQEFDVRLIFQAYDLTRSVEHNLDSPDLVELLASILKI